MSKVWTWRSARRLLVALLLFLALYTGIVRPWYFRWGATDAEVRGPWPGDELVAGARGDCTRAITINVPPAAVWPWVVQLGQDRAGFYSYTFLENLVGCEMVNTLRIVPEWQNRKLGDSVWMMPPRKMGGEGRLIVAALIPERAMIMVGPPEWDKLRAGGKASGTWGFVLQPLEGGRTRLIMRTLSGSDPQPFWARLGTWVLLEPAHFVMEQKMMRTIKETAEKAAAASSSQQMTAEGL